MKPTLQALAHRIDSLSLRERVFLFFSVAVVVVALADTLVITPQLQQQRERTQLLARQNSELAQLRSQLTAATAPPASDSPTGRLQAALRAAQQERERLAAETRAPGSAGTASPHGSAGPPRLADLLARVLRRHERLSLVRLAVAAPAQESATAPTHSPTTGRSTAPAGLQEVDLALSGSYLALAAYLAEIEAALPGLRWGPMQVEGPAEGSDAGALLTLRVWLPAEVS
jgi:MSHA biogenesis protein MshJ